MKTKNYFLTFALLISCFAFAQTGTTYSRAIVSNGVTRNYTIYVPQIYNTLQDTVPLVFNMHGATGTSAKQQTAEDFRKIADTANFIVVHPQGLSIPIAPGIPFNQTGWNVLGTVAAWQDDKAFIINLLEVIASQYSIDRKKVYTTGYSEGGFMSYDFACFVSGRFAAMASVSGSLVSAHYSACAPGQPIPVMEIHGTADAIIGYTGTGLTSSTNVDTMVNYWIRYNHCNSVPTTVTKLADIVDSATIDTSTVMHYVYTGGTNGANVELYKVLNGGHQIPSAPPVPTSYGTGHFNQDFTAAKEIWRFFRQYSLTSLGVTPVTGVIGTVRVGIDNQTAEENTISLYPNPSNGKFTLYVQDIENATVQVVNLLGAVVFETKVSEQHTKIDLSNSAKGIYFYKVSDSTGAIKSGKLIIE